MKNGRWIPLLCLAAASILATAPIARAVIDVRIQPLDLASSAENVLGLTVTAIDTDRNALTARVARICKGRFEAKEVKILAQEAVADHLLSLSEGQTLVAFLGKPTGGEATLLLYSGSGSWHSGRVPEADRPAKWIWDSTQGRSQPRSYFGAFNGAADRLLEMMVDHSAGRMYFPAEPLIQFKDDIVIHRFGHPIRGVAIYDIDGDGKPDLFACCEDGSRVFLQRDALKFVDVTEQLGLQRIRTTSCSFASVNGDGRADLLAGGVIYLAGRQLLKDGYTRSDLLPPEADTNVLSSAFVDLNGDGYPDVVISRTNGGLRAYLNPGSKGGRFTDASQALGLLTPECGGGLTGFFTVGDWNSNGRPDLFYAAGRGLLLIQGPDGTFHRVEHEIEFDFWTENGQTGAKSPGFTGGAAFAPLWRHDALSLAVPRNGALQMIIEEKRQLVDVISCCNETSETSPRQRACLAEDLNADGNVDLYTISGTRDVADVLHLNRGYGSFMRPAKYKAEVIPGKGHGIGSCAAAAGDVNADGANDLLLGGSDGVLRLALNDSLALRKAQGTSYHERKLLQTHIVPVILKGGMGVLDARVTLEDANGRTVSLRQIGSNRGWGSCGPDAINLAVRETGRYFLKVRYSDGRQVTRNLEVPDHGPLCLPPVELMHR